MTGRLADQSIVIVGGTSGMGLSAARACLGQGARVVVVGRDATKGAELERTGGSRVRLVEGDATLPETAVRAVAESVAAFGRLDGLYHVAGGSGRSRGDGPVDQITDDGWSYTLRQNLDSLFYSNRAAIRQLLEQGTGGAILNMSSVLAEAPSPKYFATHAYAATKAAARGMTRSMAAYYAPRNIRLNTIAPGLIETPMAQRVVQNEAIVEFVRRKQPLDGGRVGSPADLDDLVIYFLSAESRFVTGQVVCVDGGWSVTEGIGDEDDSGIE